jgi:hypothetical protein
VNDFTTEATVPQSPLGLFLFAAHSCPELAFRRTLRSCNALLLFPARPHTAGLRKEFRVHHVVVVKFAGVRVVSVAGDKS